MPVGATEPDLDPAGRLDRLDCLAGRTWRVVDLPGGLTNRNLRVTSTDGPDAGPSLDVVVRCAQGDAALLGIDRDAEHHDTLAAARAGVGPPVVEHRPDLGVLVIGYLPGAVLDDPAFDDPGVLARAADAVRRLHAGPPFRLRFDMFARQAAYRHTVAERGFALPASYDDHAAAWADVRRVLALAPRPLVPCHNDLLAANVIDDGDAAWLIDFEYAGMNEASFELGNTATECGFDDDRVEDWVRAHDPAASRADHARVRLQMLVSAYGWALWGFIQAAASPLDFDFGAWGSERLDKAAAGFAAPTFARLLQDVAGG